MRGARRNQTDHEKAAGKDFRDTYHGTRRKRTFGTRRYCRKFPAVASERLRDPSISPRASLSRALITLRLFDAAQKRLRLSEQIGQLEQGANACNTGFQ